MNLAGEFFDEELRRSLRLAAGQIIPPPHLDEVVDMAMHAAEQAFATLSRLTVDLNTGPIGISAASVAVGLLRHRATEVEQAFRSASASLGMPNPQVMVTVQR